MYAPIAFPHALTRHLTGSNKSRHLWRDFKPPFDANTYLWWTSWYQIPQEFSANQFAVVQDFISYCNVEQSL